MKKLLGAITFWLLLCSAGYAQSLGEQLIKLEGMYERGTITKEEFTKAKSILLKMDEDSSERIEKAKEIVTEKQKEQKKKLIQDLQAEVNQTKTHNYEVRKYAANSPEQWERMEFIIDDYRIYAHRPGAIKIKRISDGKTLAIIRDKFKIKFKNGGENLFVVTKYEKNTLEKKESGIEGIDQLNKLKTAIEENIFEVILPRKKLPGKITFEYNGAIILSWERAFIAQHNAHFFQLLALDDQPFHFYAVKDQKKFALNMGKFVKKIDIAIAEVKVELAKKYDLTIEEIDLIIKKRKQNYNNQLAAVAKETGKAIEKETAKALGQEVSKAVNIEVAKKVDAQLEKELDQAVGKEIATELTKAVEQALDAEIDAAVKEQFEKELAIEIDAAIAASIQEGISAATAEAAIRAGIEALVQGASIEQAIAVCKGAGGGDAACS